MDPATVLPLFPGLDFVMGSVRGLAGRVDPALILNLGLLLAACSTILHYTRELLYNLGRRCCISEVEIDGLDPVYMYLMRWMTAHQVTLASKTVRATAFPQNTEEDYQESLLFRDGEESCAVGDPSTTPVSFRSLATHLPIRLVPSGQYTFWHRGTRFVFEHSTQKMDSKSDFRDIDNRITLRCWARSLAPMRDLLREAQAEFDDTSGQGTQVYRSCAGPGGQFHWRQVTHRPTRSLDTVILDGDKKARLVADMNDYLLPSTRKWYAEHGIPYRRGYLFSGSPGTGKTSLAFALAGVFGLAIYSVSLADPEINESELMNLFATLPKHSVVLLEDVDAAGLKRTGLPGGESCSADAVAVAAAVAAHGGGKSGRGGGLSLSGLLNTIDGVGSKEGRVLIMTTNAPDALDSALIRPGRVDVRVHFDLASRDQLRELFLSMYRGAKNISEGKTVVPDKDSLAALAEEFSNLLPTDRLSLAAVQGHLLHYKQDPRGAVAEAQAWLKSLDSIQIVDKALPETRKTANGLVVDAN